MLHATIMAGGGGTRFWPRSRIVRPKQFLTFSGDRSLLQGTLDRIEAAIPPERTWVLTGATHAGEAATQLPTVPANNIVGEPFGRDTAACIGLGAALIAAQDPEGTMIVMPSDHVIDPAAEFQRAVHAAARFADEYPESLLTFGIPPTYPATGYGYIHRGEAVGDRLGIVARRVTAFKEKPDAATAQQFVDSGEYFWNAGIFIWKVKTILAELAKNAPEHHAAALTIAKAWGTPQQAEVFAREYDGLKKISIDFAVMEKAESVLVIQAPYQWDDVGSWLALERRNPQDAAGNTIQADHCGIATENCVIVGERGRLITTIGVRNLLIVQDGDSLLVADRNEEATVKNLVDKLKAEGWGKYL